MTRSPEYVSWIQMRSRCHNKKATGYKYYGGAGIRVCERWNKFENFLSDMGSRPAGTSIERINNDGNYEPSNCRWATSSQQASNRRPSTLREVTMLTVRIESYLYDALKTEAAKWGRPVNRQMDRILEQRYRKDTDNAAKRRVSRSRAVSS